MDTPATVVKPFAPSDTAPQQLQSSSVDERYYDSEEGAEDEGVQPSARRRLEMEDNERGEGGAAGGGGEDGENEAGRAKVVWDRVTVTYEPTDRTEAIPHPVKHLFITDAPCDVSSLKLVFLPNPRSGRLLSYGVCLTKGEGSATSEGTGIVLLELQRHRPRFCTFVVNDFVEPESPLTFAFPMDPTYFALALVKQSSRPESFVDFEELQNSNPKWASLFRELPRQVLNQIEAALSSVSDVRSIDSQQYYRFSQQVADSWFQRKLSSMMNDPAIIEISLGRCGTTSAHSASEDGLPVPTSFSNEELTILKEKSCRFLLEYIPQSLHQGFCDTVGVSQDCRIRAGNANPAGQNGSPTAAGGGAAGRPSHWDTSRKRGREDEEEVIVEKKAPDFKSAAVKRLEKAGPPKGTPSIMSFFKPKPTPQ